MNFFAKKFGGLEKSLYLCKVLNDKQQKKGRNERRKDIYQEERGEKAC